MWKRSLARFLFGWFNTSLLSKSCRTSIPKYIVFHGINFWSLFGLMVLKGVCKTYFRSKNDNNKSVHVLRIFLSRSVITTFSCWKYAFKSLIFGRTQHTEYVRFIGIPIDGDTSPSKESEYQFWGNLCILYRG